MGENCMSCGVYLTANDMPYKNYCPYCKGEIKMDLWNYSIKKAIKSVSDIYPFESEYLQYINLKYIKGLNEWGIVFGEIKNFMVITGLKRTRANKILNYYLEQLGFYSRKFENGKLKRYW